MRIKLSFAVVLLLSISPLSHAYLKAGDALRQLEGTAIESEIAGVYISGIAEAYWWGSIFNKEMKLPGICLPSKQALQTRELLILATLSLTRKHNSHKKGSKELADFLQLPVSEALFFAWLDEFPCKW